MERERDRRDREREERYFLSTGSLLEWLQWQELTYVEVAAGITSGFAMFGRNLSTWPILHCGFYLYFPYYCINCLLTYLQRYIRLEVQQLVSSLAIREIQIKTALRLHLTLVKMAHIQKTTTNTCW